MTDYLDLDYTTVLNKCLHKRDQAMCNDRYFDRDKHKYVWVLGTNVFYCLFHAMRLGIKSNLIDSPEKNVYKLMDIDIHIDTDSYNTIRLFKEV